MKFTYTVSIRTKTHVLDDDDDDDKEQRQETTATTMTTTTTIINKKLSYRRETARQLCMST